jgi:hypothetical protein
MLDEKINVLEDFDGSFKNTNFTIKPLIDMMKELLESVMYPDKDQLDSIETKDIINETIRVPLLRGSYNKDDERYINELELYCKMRFPEYYIDIYKRSEIFTQKPRELLNFVIHQEKILLGDMKYIIGLDMNQNKTTLN